EPVLDDGGFKHGHTYAGNPLSTAIACEVVKIIQRDGLVENSRIMGEYLHERLRDLQSRHPIIGDVRGKGLLAGVEFVMTQEDHTPFPTHWTVAIEATLIAREHGLLIYPRRPLYGLRGDHVLIAPPLIIDRAGIDELIGIFERTVVDLEKSLEERLVARQYEEEFAAGQEELAEADNGQLPEGITV